ncbi:hypothetical protein IscW_ISCW013790 [Ixodes scapularis]|uniref:Uncharacterized protein n=1 Tax=Ixodes scapularis TaxID=6945 RepID=B7QM45_IXOSC|nr:hypothetical protein IscW_ISCW013790 [Ixodes scapularis]|eukprot:XP_002416250.1 hypothetical protein IscW_ISCW013790 [Ixodes scapularis]
MSYLSVAIAVNKTIYQDCLSYVNKGKLMGGMWLEQHTEDLRAFGEEVSFNFTNPDVDMPIRVKENDTFKITARLCRKFHPVSSIRSLLSALFLSRN